MAVHTCSDDTVLSLSQVSSDCLSFWILDEVSGLFSAPVPSSGQRPLTHAQEVDLTWKPELVWRFHSLVRCSLTHLSSRTPSCCTCLRNIRPLASIAPSICFLSDLRYRSSIQVGLLADVFDFASWAYIVTPGLSFLPHAVWQRICTFYDLDAEIMVRPQHTWDLLIDEELDLSLSLSGPLPNSFSEAVFGEGGAVS